MAITPFKVIQCHQFRHQWKTNTRFCVNSSNWPSVMYRFRDMADYLCNFWPRQGIPLFNTRVEVKPCIPRWGNLVSETVNISIVWRKAQFDILNCLGVTHDRQTNRETDSLIAYAALHYVARSKMTMIKGVWNVCVYCVCVRVSGASLELW